MARSLARLTVIAEGGTPAAFMNRSDFPPPGVSGVTLAILEHLAHHPDAKDTREGIATWWLQQRRIESTAEDVVRGLEYLLSRQFIVESHGAERRPYYSVNRNMLEEIRRLLGQAEG